MTQLLPPKKEVALALLERSNVDIYLDPRAAGVVVPPQFRREPRLILKIGLNMPVPIPDLRLDDESMSCTLSFNRSPFYCVVPWTSVFAMVGDDGRGMVWPDDVPQELSVRVAEEQPSAPGALREAPPSSGGAAPSSRGKRGRAVELSPDSESGGRKKGSKKKKEEGRPLLMAVPSPPPSDPSVGAKAKAEKPEKAPEKLVLEKVSEKAPEKTEKLAAKTEKAEKSDKGEKSEKSEKAAREEAERARHPELPFDKPVERPAPAASPARPGNAGATGARPKRELPPYLRVVK